MEDVSRYSIDIITQCFIITKYFLKNFGPKANFKKRKVQLGSFNGVPSFSRLFHEKMEKVPLLKDYHTIEQCSLEYDPERGACIEPHIDDCWVW